jgi:tetratricopeptide (TPR) repeat protein
MEYIDGFSLKDLVKYQKRVPFTFAVSIGYLVCNALDYAHKQVFTLYGKPYTGVVHRDIKPANILISRVGVVKLADFGIAKPSEISLHTVGQKVMGTFSYLSPEQLNGDPLDYRCDIYSLGSVLYEIITGIKAFPQKVLSELIQKKMLNEYKPVHAFSIDVPKQLNAIINKSMELKKEKRYATAPEMAGDLLALLKKISSQAPERIVSDYLKNPKDSSTIFQKKKLGAPVILSAVMIILCALSFGALVSFPKVRQKFLGKVSGLSMPWQTPTPVLKARVPHDEPPQAKSALAPPLPTQTAEKNRAVEVLPSPVPPIKEEKSRGVGAASSDPLKAGLSFARAKRFQEAIPRLEAALQKELGETQRANATVNLMESYLSMGDAAGALRLANAKFINDGYFYLLCGKTFVMLGNYDRALESFGNAQTIPSNYNASTVREATYLWAKTLDQVYELKPNVENKKACMRAWQQFSKAFCTDGPTDQCREAQRHTALPLR